MRKITLITELLVSENASDSEIINEANRLLEIGGSDTKILVVQDNETSVYNGSIGDSFVTKKEHPVLNEVLLMECEKGLNIDTFFNDLLKEKKLTTYNILGVFNDNIYKVNEHTTKQDLINEYFKYTK